MSLGTANTIPLIAQNSTSLTIPDYVTIINPDGSVTYEKNTRYQQPTIIRRSYAKSQVPKNRYTLEQVCLKKSDSLSHQCSFPTE